MTGLVRRCFPHYIYAFPHLFRSERVCLFIAYYPPLFHALFSSASLRHFGCTGLSLSLFSQDCIISHVVLLFPLGYPSASNQNLHENGSE
ncbi:hypothetical protein JAAARDRAFT_657700 [Jaapia argillacea MUCL 33604]|uniref:Uncharacterized protein n=1 Tax=Jaapia argillacea MUCL 33604 TaxID=933084 RepID=A0A067PX13_9AGAM|nr:hypothetical protein JAAARDRAFT_657700 [Jaapia argillacea MUCL 33604]